MTLLAARNLTYRHILKQIDLSIAPGDCIALLGANGAGKSTLLKLLLGLLKPCAGQVLLNDQDLARLGRRHIAQHLAYVPQSHVPSFPFSVRQIISQGRLPVAGLGRALGRDDHDAVAQALGEMGIQALADRVYTELSGGERQLVLIARALVQQARVIILDEPTTGLDFGHQLRLLDRLQHLAERGLSVLASTHRPEHALTACNRVWVLHQGQLIADGAPTAVVDSALIERLYAVKVRQVEAHAQRFFISNE